MRRLKLRVLVLGMLCLLGLLAPLQALAATAINSIAIDPSAQTITRPATSTSYTLTFTPGGDGNGSAAMSVESLPAGVSWQLNSPLPTLTNKMPAFTRTLTLTIVGTVAEGVYPFTVRVVSNASIVATAQGTLTVAKITQTITSFTFSEAELNVDGPTTATVSATGGGSGNPVVFSSLTPAVCTVSGSTVNVVTVGTCTVAADQAGNADYSAAAQVTGSIQVVDRVAPVLNVSMLSDGAVTNNPVLNISGVATDTSSLTLFVNGEEVGLVSGMFSTALLLVDGSNEITVTVVDAGNNSTSTAPRNITLNFEAPALTITSPTDNSTITQDQITIVGTVDPDDTLNVTVNGSIVGFDIDGTYTATVDALEAGLNTVEVVVADLNDNKNFMKRTVVSDAQGLSLQVAEPKQDTHVARPVNIVATDTIQGTVSGFAGDVSVTIVVDGQPPYSPAVIDGAFQQLVSFPAAAAATYAVTITATDEGSHTSSIQRNIIRIPKTTLAASDRSPRLVGDPVTFTAAVPGEGNYEYQFHIQPVESGAYTLLQAYSSANTFTWDTTGAEAGLYYVIVFVRDATTQEYVAKGSLSYGIITSPPATGATLTADYPSPQLPGPTVTFTAGADSSVAVEYQFKLKSSTETIEAQSYSSDNTWEMNTASYPADAYTVYVYVRNVGSPVASETSKALNFAVLAAAPASGATLISNLPTPQGPDQVVTFTAAAKSTVDVEYRFMLKSLAGILEVQGYSPDDTWEMYTNDYAPGTYTVLMYARNVGSVMASETSATRLFNILAAPPATNATLTASLPSPQIQGPVVIFTAGATSSVDVEYQFKLKASTGITEVQAYSDVDTWEMNTADYAPGVYTVYVYVRNQGSTVASETSKYLSFKILAK